MAHTTRSVLCRNSCSEREGCPPQFPAVGYTTLRVVVAWLISLVLAVLNVPTEPWGHRAGEVVLEKPPCVSVGRQAPPSGAAEMPGFYQRRSPNCPRVVATLAYGASRWCADGAHFELMPQWNRNPFEMYGFLRHPREGTQQTRMESRHNARQSS